MRLIITGHREEKLDTYNKDWVALTVGHLVHTLNVDYGVSLTYSGMASGVDLWFCEACFINRIPFVACIPFEEQSDYMSEPTRLRRDELIKLSVEVKHVKNSWMVEHADMAIVVWDGNKGGTHNVVQQLVEKRINFWWINPVSEVIWKCFT